MMQGHRFVKPKLDKLERKSLVLGDGKTPSQLLAMAKFAEVSAQAEDFIKSSTFRMAKEHEDVEIVYLIFNDRPTTAEVLILFEKFNLEEPTEEDALRFAVKYPREQIERPIVFLHMQNPWMARHSFSNGVMLPHVLVLGSRLLKPKLFCHQLPEGHDTLSNWFNNYRFAARVRRAK
jgi:hypothetical protein